MHHDTSPDLNDWVWFPLLVFGWLPILYFSRVTSVPEYFGRRFDARVRMWATAFVLISLIGYVDGNLFTMGKVLNALVGWEIPTAALLVAVISGTYVTAGGQTSVIMTDLLQGVMLLSTGALILFLSIEYLGGFTAFWQGLPREARLAFPNFNEDPGFPSVGMGMKQYKFMGAFYGIAVCSVIGVVVTATRSRGEAPIRAMSRYSRNETPHKRVKSGSTITPGLPARRCECGFSGSLR